MVGMCGSRVVRIRTEERFNVLLTPDLPVTTARDTEPKTSSGVQNPTFPGQVNQLGLGLRHICTQAQQ